MWVRAVLEADLMHAHRDNANTQRLIHEFNSQMRLTVGAKLSADERMGRQRGTLLKVLKLMDGL